MRKIASFEVDHNKLLPGLYISRADGDVVTYDLRLKKPNANDYLDPAATHTLEHLIATYVRNSEFANNIIYFGPMGCRTGFYLLVREISNESVIDLVQKSMQFCKDFDGEVPGVSAVECGNYLEHNLSLAKDYARKYFRIVENYSVDCLKY